MQKALTIAAAITLALLTPAFAQEVDRLREEDVVRLRDRITDIDKLSAEAGIRQPTPPGERARYGARIGGRGADDDRQADDPLSGLGAGIADEGMRIQREMMQPGGGMTAPGAGAGGTGFEGSGSAAQGPGGMGMGAGGAGGGLGATGGGAAGAGSSASGGSGGGGSGRGGSGGGSGG